MVGSCGKTENRNRYRDIWKTDTETDTDFWKNRPKNRKPTPTYKTDTDPALPSSAIGNIYIQRLQMFLPHFFTFFKFYFEHFFTSEGEVKAYMKFESELNLHCAQNDVYWLLSFSVNKILSAAVVLASPFLHVAKYTRLTVTGCNRGKIWVIYLLSDLKVF